MVKKIQQKYVCPSAADLSVELWLDIDNNEQAVCWARNGKTPAFLRHRGMRDVPLFAEV